ncbi:MAG TPA: tetratricopeptide repeat protein [Vicinamibacteria bacterium]|nr:tetratricopeptide repeat protein [Vicinamibacteria bacterium]
MRAVLAGRGARLAWIVAAAFAAVHADPVLADPPSAPRATSPEPRSAAAGTFDAVVKKAEAAKEAGRYDEAIQYYRQALKLKPSWREGRFLLGTLLYDNDHPEEARDEFRRLVQADPQNGMVLALKGLCEFQLKNYERALKELQAARALGIPSPELMSLASYHIAILLNRFEQYESAFEVLRDFALLNKDIQTVIEAFGLSILRMPLLPSEAPADRRELILMAGRAGFHQAKGRATPTGRMAFEELVSRYPNAPNVHYAYGVFLVRDQPEAGLEEFRRELRSSPNHHHAMLQIAYELMKEGKYEEARPYAEKAVDLAPNLFVAHHALGRIQFQTGDVDKAIDSLETARRLAPDSPEVRFSLARAYAKAGRAEEAARERAEFVKLDKARSKTEVVAPAKN